MLSDDTFKPLRHGPGMIKTRAGRGHLDTPWGIACNPLFPVDLRRALFKLAKVPSTERRHPYSKRRCDTREQRQTTDLTCGCIHLDASLYYRGVPRNDGAHFRCEEGLKAGERPKEDTESRRSRHALCYTSAARGATRCWHAGTIDGP